MAKSKWATHIEPFIDTIVYWAETGATTKDICGKLKISENTFYEALKKHQDFADAFARARICADDQIERALFNRAKGCSVTETTVMRDADGCETTKIVTKEIPPDPTSIIFWLTNRRPDKWKSKRGDNAQTESDEGGIIMIPGVSDECDMDPTA